MKKLLLCTACLAFYATSAEATTIINRTSEGCTVNITYTNGDYSKEVLASGERYSFPATPTEIEAVMDPHGTRVNCTIPEKVEDIAFTLTEDPSKSLKDRYSCAIVSSQQKRGK